jgi:hypothetical protein
MLGDTWIHVTRTFHWSNLHSPCLWGMMVQERKAASRSVQQVPCSKNQDPDWSQGIHVAWIKDEWKGDLIEVHIYITGEGRFIIIHCYHLCFLMHLSGDKEINLPYYMLKSLTKMAKRVQGHPESTHKKVRTMRV